MSEITIFVKNSAKDRDLLDSIDKPEPDSGNTLRVVRENLPQEPIVSRASLGEVLDVTNRIINQYFSAEGLIVIVVSNVIGNAAYDFLKALVKKILGVLSKNNRQKGNAWGAKIELKQELKSGKEQTLHFFLDGIPENILFEAISSIQSRVSDFNRVLGQDYLEQIKHLGFSYKDGDWKMIGAEKFSGETELPPAI